MIINTYMLKSDIGMQISISQDEEALLRMPCLVSARRATTASMPLREVNAMWRKTPKFDRAASSWRRCLASFSATVAMVGSHMG